MSGRINALADALYRNATAPDDTPFTVTMRVQLVTDRNAVGILWSHGNGAGAYQDIGIQSNGTELAISTSAGNTATGDNMTVSTWHHVAYVRNGTAHEIYLDGVSVGTLTASITQTPVVFLIGSNTSSAWVDARFKDVGIWTIAKDAAAIAAERNANGAPASTTSLWAYYPLTTDANDTSGNARHLTTAGTIGWEANPPVVWLASVDVIGVNDPAPTIIATGGGGPTVEPAVDIIGVADPAVTVITAPLASTALTLNAGNPLIANGPETYDALKAGPRHVVKFASNDYRMIYEAIANDGLSTTVAAYATSTDGTAWTKYGSNPIISATETWEGPEVAPTTWFWDGAIQKYVLYYHGGGNSVPRKIGRATADSPVGPWTKYAGNPVLSPGGSGTYDFGSTGDCKVLKVGAVYHMWYGGENGTGGFTKIHHATSSDGITWTKDAANPVLSAGTSGAWDDGDVQSPAVWYDPTYARFHMWYVGDDGGDSTTEALGYAYSADGTTWTKGASNPVLTRPGPANIYIGDTLDVYRDGNIYRVSYGYFNFNAAARREIHEATLTVAGAIDAIPSIGADAVGVADPVVTVVIGGGGTPVTFAASVDVVGVADPAVTVTALQAVTYAAAVDAIGVADPSATVTALQAVTYAAAVDAVGVADPAATVTALQAVTATPAVDVVGIADPAATIKTGITFVASVDAVGVADPAAIIKTGITYAAAVDVIGVADPQATVTALQAAIVLVSVDVVGIADPSVSVSVGGAVSVGAGVDAVAVAQPAATIVANQVLTVAASVDVLGVADPAVTVVTGIAVTFAASVDVLGIADPAATVSAGGVITVLAGVDAIALAQPAVTVVTAQAVTVLASVDAIAIVQFAPGVFTTAVSVTFPAPVDIVAIVQPQAIVIIAIMVTLKAKRDLVLRTGRDLALDAQRNKVLVSRR